MRTVMIGAALALTMAGGAAAAKPKAPQCVWTLKTDPAITLPKTVVASTLANIQATFSALCGAKKVKPGVFKGFDTLTMRDGEGATEPHFFPTEDKGVLSFEYFFDRKTVPTKKEIVGAFECFVKPTEMCLGD
jgi:hypothetical protein